MIRVLQVFDSIEISGGVQAVIMNAYRKIDRTKIQFDFACYHDAENSYQPEIEALGGRVIKIKCLSEAGFVGFYTQFLKLFDENHYDAVHAHNIHHNGLILLAAKRKGIANRISHAHQAYDEYNAKSYRRLIALVLMKLNLQVATQFVACSDKAAEFLYGKNHPYIFLPNAIDLSVYEKLPSKEELRRQYGIAQDAKILIHIGRMAPPKNQLFLVEIMKELKDTPWKLLIAGDGYLREQLEGAILTNKVSDKIELLGLRTDCPALLMMADIMLLPSIYEGLPVTGVEAQAAGCYSILSDVITRQTDIGLGLVKFLPIDDPAQWAKAIERCMLTSEKDAFERLNAINAQSFGSSENIKLWEQLYSNEKGK